MTIIQPKKYRKKINLLMIGMFLILFGVVYSNISLYNSTVNLKHVIGLASERLDELKVLNADLKNRVYQITDAKNLISFAKENGLIKTKPSQYLGVSQAWSVVSASQF